MFLDLIQEGTPRVAETCPECAEVKGTMKLDSVGPNLLVLFANNDVGAIEEPFAWTYEGKESRWWRARVIWTLTKKGEFSKSSATVNGCPRWGSCDKVSTVDARCTDSRS
jgi:hypothetical protein